MCHVSLSPLSMMAQIFWINNSIIENRRLNTNVVRNKVPVFRRKRHGTIMAVNKVKDKVLASVDHEEGTIDL